MNHILLALPAIYNSLANQEFSVIFFYLFIYFFLLFLVEKGITKSLYRFAAGDTLFLYIFLLLIFRENEA